jgi:hypothetical protein
MDVETAGSTENGSSRFRKLLAVLVGTTAVYAALLTALHGEIERRGERAALLSTRLSATANEVLGVRGLIDSLRHIQEIDKNQLGAQGMGRVATGTGPPAADREWGAGQAELAAATRLGEIPLVPTSSDTAPLDPHTARVLTMDDSAIQAVIDEQNRQVDLAGKYGDRSDRTFLALSLLAVAAVFLGLAGLLGATRLGRLSLGGAGALLVVSAVAAASAFLV